MWRWEGGEGLGGEVGVGLVGDEGSVWGWKGGCGDVLKVVWRGAGREVVERGFKIKEGEGNEGVEKGGGGKT